MQVSLFPSLDLVAEDVGVAQSGAASTAEMATAKTLSFGLQLTALLGGKIKMTEVTLIDPVITVPQGRRPPRAAEDAAPPQADALGVGLAQNLSASTSLSSRTVR